MALPLRFNKRELVLRQKITDRQRQREYQRAKVLVDTISKRINIPVEVKQSLIEFAHRHQSVPKQKLFRFLTDVSGLFKMPGVEKLPSQDLKKIATAINSNPLSLMNFPRFTCVIYLLIISTVLSCVTVRENMQPQTVRRLEQSQEQLQRQTSTETESKQKEKTRKEEKPLFPNLPYTESQVKHAVEVELDGLFKWLQNRTLEYFSSSPRAQGRIYLWGPALDDANHYRLENWIDEVSAEEYIASYLRLKDAAIAKGIPRYNPTTVNRIHLMHYYARASGLSETAILTPKHFPGGTQILETHIEPIHVSGKLKEAEATFMQPFIKIIKGTSPPGALMLSHANYEFEIELLELHPELRRYLEHMAKDRLRKYSPKATYNPEKIQMPATVSPLIIRGYLRKTLGYEGLIVTDYYNMTGLLDYFGFGTDKSVRGIVKGHGSELTIQEQAKLVSDMIYAGINLPLGVSKYCGGILRNKYLNDRIFRDIFDNAIMEKVYVLAKLMPGLDPRFHRESRAPFNFNLVRFSELSDSSNINPELLKLRAFIQSTSFEQKFVFYLADNPNAFFDRLKVNSDFEIQTQSKGTFVQRVETDLYYDGRLHEDLRSRSGELERAFRSGVVASLRFNRSYPFQDKDVMSERDDSYFLPESRKIFDGIDWTHPAILGAMDVAIAKFEKIAGKKP